MRRDALDAAQTTSRITGHRGVPFVVSTKTFRHPPHSPELDQDMRQLVARRLVMTGLALALALAARPAWTADKAPNDRLLPPSTYLYVTVPNVSDITSGF